MELGPLRLLPTAADDVATVSAPSKAGRYVMLGGRQGTGPSHHRSGADSLTPRRLGQRERWTGVCARPGRRSASVWPPRTSRTTAGTITEPYCPSAVARSLGDKADRQLDDAARDRLADETTSRARCRPAHRGEATERATSVLCVGKLSVPPLRSRACYRRRARPRFGRQRRCLLRLEGPRRWLRTGLALREAQLQCARAETLDDLSDVGFSNDRLPKTRIAGPGARAGSRAGDRGQPAFAIKSSSTRP